jgi:hypothetical protein
MPPLPRWGTNSLMTLSKLRETRYMETINRTFPQTLIILNLFYHNYLLFYEGLHNFE